MNARLIGLLAGVIVWLVSSATSWAQDNVFYKVTNKQLEKILTDLNIAFDNDPRGNIIWKAGNHNVALQTFYEGKAIVIGVNLFDYTGISLEKINKWNDDEALSRAILRFEKTKDGKTQTFARLESDLNCELGITPKGIGLFLKRFNQSLDKFKKFLKPGAGENPRDPEEVDDPQAHPAGLQLRDHQEKARDFVRQLIPDGKEVIVRFPIGESKWRTAWKIHWDVDVVRNENNHKNNFFCIRAAWFKTAPGEPWLKVLGDARASELFVAYADGKTRYYDMREFAYPLLELGEKDVGPLGRVMGNGRVAAEIRDRGILWAKSTAKRQMVSRRSQELALWACLHSANYYYLIQYAFQDDGAVTFRAGATGHNLPNASGRVKALDYPNMSHMHNTCWRVNVDLGGKSSVYLLKHKEPANGIGGAKGASEQKPELFNNGFEGSENWKPEEFTRLQIVSSLKNKNQVPICYDLVPLRLGTARHFGRNQAGYPEDFTLKDFWVTPLGHAASKHELFYYNLPRYIQNPPRTIQDQNVVIWHMSSLLHVPRGEDGHRPDGMAMKHAPGVALTGWCGFDLRPRNVFTSTPLYP